MHEGRGQPGLDQISLQARLGAGCPAAGRRRAVYIEDNGRARGGTPVDRVATEPPQPRGAFDAAAGVCTDPTLNPAWTPLESGDFEVRDSG